MSPISVIAQKATKLHADALVAGIFEDDRPLAGLSAEIDWIHNGIVSRLILRGTFGGRVKESTLLATQRKFHAGKILLVGLGMRDRMTARTLQEVYSHLRRTLQNLQIKNFALEWFPQAGTSVDEGQAVEAVLSGLVRDPVHALDLTLLVPDEEKAQRLRQRMQAAPVKS